MHFIDKLLKEIQKKSPICVGLDPRLDQIPMFIRKKNQQKYSDPDQAFASSILDFNIGIINSVKDIASVIKPQVAFYEQYGPSGMEAYSKTIRYARNSGLIVIADVKRGDIGSTSAAYAQAYFEDDAPFYTDAITINTYFGEDSVKPYYRFLEKGHAVFTQVKNSNKSSSEFQDIDVGGKKIYEIMGDLVEKWGKPFHGESGFSSVCAVVGATFKEQAKVLRKSMPHTFFLVPGYGAQGGSVEDIKNCFNDKGEGAIINSSRGIIFAYQNNKKYSDENYADAAREAVITMKKDLC